MADFNELKEKAKELGLKFVGVKKEDLEKAILEAVKGEDRSAFNCEPCKGEGLVGNLSIVGKHDLCAKCGGSGKI